MLVEYTGLIGRQIVMTKSLLISYLINLRLKQYGNEILLPLYINDQGKKSFRSLQYICYREESYWSRLKTSAYRSYHHEEKRAVSSTFQFKHEGYVPHRVGLVPVWILTPCKTSNLKRKTLQYIVVQSCHFFHNCSCNLYTYCYPVNN